VGGLTTKRLWRSHKGKLPGKGRPKRRKLGNAGQAGKNGRGKVLFFRVLRWEDEIELRRKTPGEEKELNLRGKAKREKKDRGRIKVGLRKSKRGKLLWREMNEEFSGGQCLGWSERGQNVNPQEGENKVQNGRKGADLRSVQTPGQVPCCTPTSKNESLWAKGEGKKRQAWTTNGEGWA